MAPCLLVSGLLLGALPAKADVSGLYVCDGLWPMYDIGEFSYPHGLALDGNGGLYITDRGNSRVQKWTTDGVFVAKWGRPGTGDGEFSGPRGLAVDAGGSVYVADTGNNRIQKFSASGGFLSWWGADTSGFTGWHAPGSGCTPSDGSGDGQLSDPGGVAAAKDGTLYIVDGGNARVQKLSASGSVLGWWGKDTEGGLGWHDAGSGKTPTPGTEGGAFSLPSDLALDATGTLWVADRGNHRVQVFAISGAFVRQWSVPSCGYGSNPSGISLDSGGNVYASVAGSDVYGSPTCGAIRVYDPVGNLLRELGSAGPEPGHFLRPQGVAADDGGHVYVADTYNDRIQKITTEGALVTAWGRQGDGYSEKARPSGIALDATGKVHVVDRAARRVQVFSDSGAFIRQWTTRLWGYGSGPRSIAVDRDGNAYVTDAACDVLGSPTKAAVRSYDPQGAPLHEWGQPGPMPGAFSDPGGVGVDGDDTVWVADTGNHRIQRFTTTGVLLSVVGSAGSSPGCFLRASDVAPDRWGNLYVADTGNCRVQKLATGGVPLGVWPAPDTNSLMPGKIAVDVCGNVYVVDRSEGRVWRFTGTGERVAEIGTRGQAAGHLSDPSDVTVDTAGTVYVTEAETRRVQNFRPTRLILPPVEANGPWTVALPARPFLAPQGFGQGLAFSLVGPGGHTLAAQTAQIGEGGAWADVLFDLAGAPLGSYAVALSGGASAPDALEVLPSSPPVVSVVAPNVASNAQPGTVRVIGQHLNPHATIRLTRDGWSDVVGSVVGGATGAGDTLERQFDLRGRAPGRWDVVVTNPDGLEGRLAEAFEVTGGGGPHVHLQVSGPTAVRPGRDTLFVATAGNSGSVDAYDSLLTVHLSSATGTPAQACLSVCLPELDIDVAGVPFPPMPHSVPTADGTASLVWIPKIAAGAAWHIQCMVRVPPDAGNMTLTATLRPSPVTEYWRGGSMEQVHTTVMFQAMMLLTEEVARGMGIGWGAEMASTGAVMSASASVDPAEIHQAAAAFLQEQSRHFRAPRGIWDLVKLFLSEVFKRFASMADPTGWCNDAVPYAAAGMALMATRGAYWEYVERQLSGQTQPTTSASKTSAVATAYDPNLKAGPAGAGTQRWVARDEALAYIVHYENDPEKATAPAMEVHVIDQLDANLDWGTYQVTGIHVAGVDVPVDAGTQAFGKTISATVKLKKLDDPNYPDCEPLDTQVDIEVTCEFGAATGLAKWHFVGHKPGTAEPTDFLPPDVFEDDPATPWNDIVAPQGEGWVSYSCKPKTGLPSGTRIENTASIVFDVNPAMETDLVFNTLDAGTPTSLVSALPTTVPAAFTVTWSGQDEQNGSGIGGYDVYVSDNGGPYVLWQSNTPATSAQYSGEMGHNYRFYSVARDNVGHVETAPNTYDTETTVGIPTVSHTLPAGLSMVSVPVAPVSPDPRQLGFGGDKWARWNPETGGYVSYGSDPGHYTWFEPAASVPGRGYWARFAADTPASVSGTVPSSDAEYLLEVNPGPAGGWVQIGCPRLVDVPWSITGAGALRVRKGSEEKTLAEAQAAHWCEDFAWGCAPDGDYELVYDRSVATVGARDRLQPWQGYWFYAYGPCQLVIPSVATSSAAASNPRAKDATGDWRMVIEASTSSRAKARVVAGQALYPRHMASPPPFAQEVQLSIVEGDKKLGVSLRDTKATPMWAMEARAQLPDATVALGWPDLSRLPRDCRPILTDLATGKRVYMRTSQGYTYSSGAPSGARRFEIRMAQAGEDTLAVTSVTAANTRGGNVEVRVNVSASATVDVDVLNIAGRRVGMVCQQRASERGPVTLLWNGRSESGTKLPNGRYLVRVTARTEDGQQASAVGTLQVRR